MMKPLAVCLIAAAVGFLIGRSSDGKPRATHDVTKADVTRWEKELSNSGRWGKQDEIGTVNLITPEKKVLAARLVREGFSVSLARTAMTEKAIDNLRPYQISFEAGKNADMAIDEIDVAYHGYSHTHLDALDHVYAGPGNTTYNGYKYDRQIITSKQGHARNNIVNFKGGIFTRGILIDIPRLKGIPYLEPGVPIYIEDIEAWEKKVGVKVSSGDALFIRTGRWARRAAMGPWDVSKTMAGLDPSVIPWLKQRDIATLGSDVPQSVRFANMNDLGPAGNVHDFALAILGMPLFDNCDLEALSEASAVRHRWDFLLTAAPLPLPGGTGSPINPVAVF